MEKSTVYKKRRTLLEANKIKTIDTGTGNITASIQPEGFLHSINAAHKGQGFVTLSPMNQFLNSEWYKSKSVRAYRRRMAETTEGFGLFLNGDWIRQEAFFTENHAVRLVFASKDEIKVESTYYTVDDSSSGYVVQVLNISNHGKKERCVPVVIGGIFSLNRCSYGQLTEGGPIPVPPSDNRLMVKENGMTIINEQLPARADCVFFHEDVPIKLAETCIRDAHPLRYQTDYRVKVMPRKTTTVTAVFTISEGKQGKALNHAFVDCLSSKAEEARKHEVVHDDRRLPFSSYIINRNVDYIVSCCSIPVGNEGVCVITDHQLLPLSWNRDAFYMMNLLIESAGQYGKHDAKGRVRRIVKGHLRWMFERAERPDGFWGRAYLTNGHCKDNVFQLDQQCYPLLELCRYVETFSDVEGIQPFVPLIDAILEMILSHKHEERWLFATGETPADDKVDDPYHFSSHVLLWHTLNQLAGLNGKIRFTTKPLDEWASQVKADTLDAFVAECDGKLMFAYLTDLRGKHRFYHDANDLPTVLAPVWGFCDKCDPVWKNTMEFAFTPENKGGYYEGDFAGLGSVHTPHPWPLGDGQEMLYSHLTGQTERVEQTWKKLLEIVQWDGMFPEAVDEQTGAVASRHWFSWPGAFISSVLLMIDKHS
ncbi:MAG TPA: glycoside hydrolase family 125 protein [Bacillales bacterium]|nr:glycoside hydrolase family 125 protein [Bacillales bacterium]